MIYTIPRANAPIAGEDAPTTQWYNFLRYLDTRTSSAAGDVQAEITTIAEKLGSPDGTVGNIPPLVVGVSKVRGLQSVVATGLNIVQLSLINDIETAAPVSYYGSDSTGAKGWNLVYDAFAATSNIEKINTSGIVSFDLTDLTDSGTGALLATTFDAKGRKTGSRAATITGTAGRVTVANGNASAGLPTIDLDTVSDAGGGTLQKTAFDAYGRKTGASAATTDDLAEGSTNLYFHDAPSDGTTYGRLDGAWAPSGTGGGGGGDLYVDTTPVGSVGSGETDLMSFTMAADTLSADGDRIVFRGAGSIANTGSAKELRCYFGGTLIMDTASHFLGSVNDHWIVYGEIIRKTSSTQTCNVMLVTDDASFEAEATITSTSVDLTASSILLFTGQGGADNDVVQESMTVNMGTSTAWGAITGTLADQTDLAAALAGKATSAQGAKADSAVQSVVAGTNITVDATDPQNPIVSATGGGGSGDVVGPSSATDGAVALYDGTTGKLLKDGVILGTAATTSASAYATAAQGTKADTSVQSVVAGTNVTVDSTDPQNPIVSASGGGGS